MQCIEILPHSERKKRETTFQLISENVAAECNKWSWLFEVLSVLFGSNKIIVENSFLDEYCEIFRKKWKIILNKNVLKH